MNQIPATHPDGSRLCLVCGLCCQGVLHDYAELPGAEAAAAVKIGLPVYPADRPVAFRLPCPRHVHGSCSVYADRPSTCRTYRCKLLRQYSRGEVSLESAVALIDRVKILVTKVGRALHAEDAQRSIWDSLQSFLAESPLENRESSHRGLLMDAAEILALGHGRFRNRLNPRKAMAP